MRSLAAIALIVAGFVIPVCAQRGGGHGGSSGHSGGFSGHAGITGHSTAAFHGSGPARSAPSRLVAPRNFAGMRPLGAVSSFRPRNPGNQAARQPYRGRGDGHRRPYISPYGLGYPYYGYAPWLDAYDPYLFGSEDDSDNSNTQAAPADTGQYQDGDYAQQPPIPYQQPPEQYPLPPGGPYASPPNNVQPASVTESEAVTLIFKDGRPPEQIHNYLMTRTTLYVQDEHKRSIPVDQLDIAATAKTNQDAGVDFQIPRLPN